MNDVLNLETVVHKLEIISVGSSGQLTVTEEYSQNIIGDHIRGLFDKISPSDIERFISSAKRVKDALDTWVNYGKVSGGEQEYNEMHCNHLMDDFDEALDKISK